MAKTKFGKKKTETVSIVLVALIMLAMLLYSHFSTQSDSNNSNFEYSESDMVMTAIDVGQGDSILITQGGHNILVDAGPNEAQDSLIKYLRERKIQKFDYVIATHPHADHIGGMDKIIENFEIENFLLTELPDNMIPTTKSYEKMVSALLNRKINVISAKSGQSYNIGNMSLDILAPLHYNYDDLNNFSIVAKLTYKDVSVMLCGDAEKEVEKELLASKLDLTCDIYKVAHHGSDTSSSKSFLNALNARYAVIPCGVDNSYNHPNEKTIKKLKERNIEYYVVKECGTVSFIIDGKNIKVQSERGE